MARRGLVWLLLACACFQDQPTSGGGSSTGDACMPGEVLCPCLDGECNAGLRCVPEGCIPDDCDPGTPMCTCLQPGDICVEGWACLEGLCKPPMGGTTGMTTTPPTTGIESEPTLTSVDPSTTSGQESGAVTGPMTSASSLDTSDTMAGCDDPSTCLGCINCAEQFDCAVNFTNCTDDNMGCTGLYDCIVTCLQGPREQTNMCLDACSCNSNLPLQGLVDCIAIACPDQCPALPCGS